MPVQALLVNQRVQSGQVFRRWSIDYDALNSFIDPLPPPFTNFSDAPATGIHLHWKLPSALTHGTSDRTSGNITYRYTPNRWVIVRLQTTAGATTPPSLTAWIVQSDYKGSDGSTWFLDPASTPGNVIKTKIGRNMPIEQWQGEAGGPLFLSPTGAADITFTAYEPGLLDVYAFTDTSAASLPEQTFLTYLVAGWFSDPSHDPLASMTPAQLRWNILGAQAGDPQPLLSIYHGLTSDLVWQTQQIPARIDADASSMHVAVGYTGIDALAAVIAARAGQQSGSDLELRLQAFQYGMLNTIDEPDGTAQLEVKIRNAWFGSKPGGTTWDIVAVRSDQGSGSPLGQGTVSPPPPLTPAQASWLATLNVAQRQYDVAARELMTMRWEIFALWWKQQRAPHVTGQEAFGINLSAIQQMIDAALDATDAQSVLSQVLAAQTNVANLAANVPDPTSPSSIAAWSNEIPAGGSIPLALKPRAMPPFVTPNDPVVLIAGITPPANTIDDTQPLPCRLATAATTGVDVVVGGQTKQVTAAALPTIVQLPNTSKLPPAIGTAINALAVEAFFADPNNAASIAANGLNVTDPNVVSALFAAMANGTAQISTIPSPLQARFAFAQWQQAWSPLYVEWNVTWLPSVTAAPTGDFEPPPGARINNPDGAQDDWTFDPTAWTFDGSDDVSARGGEYYQWSAGEIWARAQNPVQKQFYVGRTFLTPQTTFLFIKRLNDYLTLHPNDQGLETVQSLIDAIGETRFLSQSLSGFNAYFLDRILQQTQVPGAGTPVAHAVGDETHGVPYPEKGDQDFDFSGGSPFFFPLRGGFLQFERLGIVDAFGQILDLLQANGNSGGTAATFAPICGYGCLPDPGSGIDTPQRRVKQAPRFAQPARLDLHLLDAYDDGEEIFLSPGTNPVCGWFLPNHLDKSIAVYDAGGTPLGELLVLADTSGNETVQWLPAPDAAQPITDPSQIANPHLRDSLTVFRSASGGIPVAERVAAFRALFASIDETLWTVDPAGGAGDGDLAVLIGRPLALVRTQIQFGLFGTPAYNQSWRDTLQLQTAGALTIPLPIRLGSTELLDDGTIGYFSDDCTTFNAVHPSSTVTAPYIVPIVPANYLQLSFDWPQYTVKNLTLLVDPRGTVHAATGILPAAKISVPPQFYEPALEQMAVTFRIGPVLTDPAAIRLPFPAERNGDWSWITHVGTGSSAGDPNWRGEPIIPATPAPRLADHPPRLVDGWLQFVPKSQGAKE
jgi:hypothetical protein